jgi:DNA polymerase III alpha subunit
MAVFILEDFSGKIEVVAFPKTFAMSSKNIYPESIVLVEGR